MVECLRFTDKSKTESKTFGRTNFKKSHEEKQIAHNKGKVHHKGAVLSKGRGSTCAHALAYHWLTPSPPLQPQLTMAYSIPPQPLHLRSAFLPRKSWALNSLWSFRFWSHLFHKIVVLETKFMKSWYKQVASHTVLPKKLRESFWTGVKKKFKHFLTKNIISNPLKGFNLQLRFWPIVNKLGKETHRNAPLKTIEKRMIKAGAFDRYFELEYWGRCLLGIRSWADEEFTEHGDHRDTQQASKRTGS